MAWLFLFYMGAEYGRIQTVPTKLIGRANDDEINSNHAPFVQFLNYEANMMFVNVHWI